ncbi:MAG: Abi family protein, partial [Pseudomonas sp.]
MPKTPYIKPALTLDQQVQQLRARGMVIADELLAKHYLGYINYYRLGAYWLPFELDHASHQFQPGTTFEQVLDRYVFDR